jgi:lipid II isoglutaminyl synthase (glutamine-hydrolysing)
VATRLLLAKNPAGWEELLALVEPDTAPVVIAINARTADGRDPSWLWDVDFERLSGRPIVATGERSADLSVRLHYAGVEHERVADPVEAVAVAARLGDRRHESAPVEFIGNYTAFNDLLQATGTRSKR